MVVILVVLVVMVAVVVNIHTWSLLPLTFMCALLFRRHGPEVQLVHHMQVPQLEVK
jgi:hypothetical protein